MDDIPLDKISCLQNVFTRATFEKLRRVVDARMTHIYGQEVALYSDHFQIAGRGDMVCNFDGRPSILDYKTALSTRPKEWLDNYFMQTCYYAIAWEERTGQPIDQLVVIMAADDHKDATVYVEHRDTWAPKLEAYIAQWKKDNPNAYA